MRGRLVAVGVGLASLLALGTSSIMQGCYSAPEPACGFLCGTTPPCPADYQQLMIPSPDGNAQVCRCVLPGTTAAQCALVDAGGMEAADVFLPDGSPIDAAIDGPVDVPPDAMIDAEVIPDSMIDAAVIPDAMVDAPVPPDAMVDAAITPDAMVDAFVMPDAAIDAVIPDAMVDAAATPDAAIDAGVTPDAADDAAIPAD